MKMDTLFIVVVGLFVVQFFGVSNANFVFSVERKFKNRHASLGEIKNHDSRRRGRFLSAVDLPLGGDGLPTSSGLYYTKLGLGSPVKHFYVDVDTGSDILWVNCVGCTGCPEDLTRYDLNDSKTAELVYCHDMPCRFKIAYEDGYTVFGSYMQDYLTFDRINGNLHTVPINDTVIFGCTNNQSSSPPHDGLDGMMGFAQANISVLSQLAASGKVKRIFSHCLDSINGGGIFSIGELVAPKFNTTPLVPTMADYSVVLKDIEVDGEAMQLRMDLFDTGNGRRTIIDSGTTLAYLPGSIYDQLLTMILARGPYIIREEFFCFHYSNKSDDEGFPVLKFHFEGLSLTVYPHDYLFFVGDVRCIGWLKTQEEKDPIIFGDMVLSNKLIVYDLEKMAIGWMDYNCSRSIKVKDDKTGSAYTVGPKHLPKHPSAKNVPKRLSSASTVLIGRMLTFFLLLIALLST